MTDFQHILNKEFVKNLISLGGEVYFVGGCVRDSLLGKTPKDIDVVVRNLIYDILVAELKKFGKVDVVGESFGVIKFKEFKTNFEMEIALPRTDSKDEGLIGHKSIIAQSNPLLSIEEDLFRRDFTINSIALDSNLNYIDPYNGISDLKNKKINATNKDAFKDDPLRMLRALQFAARFDFDIEECTLIMIGEQKDTIKEISPERILMEFEKVFAKNGNVAKFYSYLITSGLYKSIYGFGHNRDGYTARSTTLAEFLFLTAAHYHDFKDTHLFLQSKFKIDNNTVKIVKALDKFYLELVYNKEFNNDLYKFNYILFNVLQIYPDAYKLKTISSEFEIYIEKCYPKSFTELALTGDDLVIKFGLKEGPKIGEIRRALLTEILSDRMKNTYEDCCGFVESNFAVKKVTG